MTIQNTQQLVEAELAGKSQFFTFRKQPNQTTANGIWFDLSLSPGNPVPNYYAAAPNVAIALAQSTDGGIYHGGAVAPESKFVKTIGMQVGSATASFEASATFGFDGDAIRLPVNDAPPLRSASATFDLSGALSPYAIGHMIGTTADAGVTVDNIVNGVWNAAQTNFILPGSTGYTLSLAGAGGVDYVALSTAVWTALNRTLSTPYPSSADIAAEILATPYP